MSTTPPDQPTPPREPPPPPSDPGPPPADQPTQPTTTYAQQTRPQFGMGDIARLPIPGNAEFALWLLLEVVFTLLWWFDDAINSSQWMTITTALTFGYFISRGIAKASRVLEQ
jgi:hypothetical protein